MSTGGGDTFIRCSTTEYAWGWDTVMQGENKPAGSNQSAHVGDLAKPNIGVPWRETSYWGACPVIESDLDVNRPGFSGGSDSPKGMGVMPAPRKYPQEPTPVSRAV
jgi:hypothetical protein